MRNLSLSFAAVVVISGSWGCTGPSGGQQGGTGGGQFGVGGGQQLGDGGGSAVGGGFVGGTTGGGDGVGGGISVGGGSCGQPQDSNPLVLAWRPPPAISGGTMTVLSNGTAAIADSDRDEVHFVADNFAISHAALQPGDEPGRVVEGPGGTVFVALRRAGAVARVDVSTLQVQRFSVCNSPRGLAWRDSLKQLVVACSDGELSTLDFSSGAPALTTKRLTDDLRDVLVLNGQLLVTTFRDAQVYAVDAQGGVSLWAKTIGVADGVHFLAPEVAWRTVVSGSGLLMVHQRADTAAIPESQPCFSPWGTGSSGGFGGGSGGGAGSSGNSTLTPALSALQPGQATDFASLATFALPVDVAVDSVGKHVAVAFAGGGLVQLHDTSSNADVPIFTGGEPVSVAFRGSTLLVYSREPAELLGFDSSGVRTTELPLSSLSMKDTGHELFHQQTANAIACASCHPEATDDGHIWDLPKGLRRTPSLRGGLKGTEPFHWDGEEATMGSLVSDVFVDRMGGLAEPDDHVAALLNWVDAQPKRPAPGDLDAAAVARGQAAFDSLGCGSCHSGALGTGNASVDIGTGGAFQVPRLVELAYRAPFFHDGRVASLADRFSSVGGSGHTATSGLSADQISDLVAYLKSR